MPSPPQHPSLNVAQSFEHWETPIDLSTLIYSEQTPEQPKTADSAGWKTLCLSSVFNPLDLDHVEGK